MRNDGSDSLLPARRMLIEYAVPFFTVSSIQKVLTCTTRCIRVETQTASREVRAYRVIGGKCSLYAHACSSQMWAAYLCLRLA